MNCAISMVLTELANGLPPSSGKREILAARPGTLHGNEERDNYRAPWGELQDEASARVMEQVGNIITFL